MQCLWKACKLQSHRGGDDGDSVQNKHLDITKETDREVSGWAEALAEES